MHAMMRYTSKHYVVILAYLYLFSKVSSSNEWFDGNARRGEMIRQEKYEESGKEQHLVRIMSRSALASANASGLDPIQNMCERFYHQSTIKNNILYIYAGAETYVAANEDGRSEGPITMGTNNFMIAVNMSDSWDWRVNISENLLTPAASPPPGNTYPPVVIRGALFAGGPGDDNIYIYGGTTSGLNTSFVGYNSPASAQYALWSYDTVVDQWGQYDLTLTTQRPSGGAYAEASDQHLAFYLNGEITNGTSTATEGIGSDLMSLEGLVIVDTAGHTSRNASTTSLVGSNPRTGGVLQYVSGIGSKGILVAIGGSYRQSMATTTDDIGTLLPMDIIDVLDINSTYNGGDGTWYTQQATGDIPPSRTQFCAVVAAAPDNSSYNIYVYGGQASSTDLFDDIYVLSLPSFIWTKVYEASIPIPRYGHTCHLVGRRQMLTVGGSGSTAFNSCDWETKGVAIYDMTDLVWGSEFDYYAPDYGVPALVTANIGGNSNGSANVTQPVGGFTAPGLAALFKERLQGNTTSGNLTPGNSTTETSHGGSGAKKAGIITGSVVGSIVVILILWLAWRAFQSSRRHRNPQTNLLQTTHAERNNLEMGESAPSRSRSPSLENVIYDHINPVGRD